jgi:hypothetical protein
LVRSLQDLERSVTESPALPWVTGAAVVAGVLLWRKPAARALKRWFR